MSVRVPAHMGNLCGSSNPAQQGQLQTHAMKFIGNSLNSSGWGIASPLSKIGDVRFYQWIPVNMEKKSKGGVCLQRPCIWSSDIVCLLFLLSEVCLWEKFLTWQKFIVITQEKGTRRNKQAKECINKVGEPEHRASVGERRAVCRRSTQVLLMFDQLLSYYSSCYRCSCNLCNRMFKKMKEKV